MMAKLSIVIFMTILLPLAANQLKKDGGVNSRAIYRNGLGLIAALDSLGRLLMRWDDYCYEPDCGKRGQPCCAGYNCCRADPIGCSNRHGVCVSVSGK